jgi:hypothetical protein
VTTLADVLASALADAGIPRAVAGPGVDPLPGLATTVLDDPDLACRVADADGRLGPEPGVAVLAGPPVRIRISSLVGGPADGIAVPSDDRLPRLVELGVRRAGGPRPDAVELALERPLDAVPFRAARVGGAVAEAPVVPPDIPFRPRTLVLAGPGVVRAGTAAVEGLRAFAARAGLAVANTWGAKGVFEWDSPHHMSTVGLQERDFEILGFGEADLLIATGVDAAESPPERWALAPLVVEVDPRALADLADAWPHPTAEIRPNDFLARMSAVCQPLFADDRFPMSPGRAVAEVRATMVPGDVVVAAPGPAGLWVARSFSTVTLGSVVVPATVDPGFAAAAALAAALRRPRTPAVAITTGPVGAETVAALDAARSLGEPLVLEVWGDDPGPAAEGAVAVTGIEHHRDALLAARAGGGVTVLHVPVDFGDTDRLVEVAGPVVAWPSLAIG